MHEDPATSLPISRSDAQITTHKASVTSFSDQAAGPPLYL